MLTMGAGARTGALRATARGAFDKLRVACLVIAAISAMPRPPVPRSTPPSPTSTTTTMMFFQNVVWYLQSRRRRRTTSREGGKEGERLIDK